jgi:EpsI family protein
VKLRTNLRVVLVLVLLLGTAAFLRSRSRAEDLPPRAPLDDFPQQVGDWKGNRIYIADDVRKILGDGDFMQQVYWRSPDEPAVELFIAYFPSQRTGSTIHSPKNCLPGSGWVPVEALHVPVTRPDGSTIEVNRYVIQKSNMRRLVIYWYQAHDRVVASEYWAKIYMVADAFRRNRTDGALVRVISSLGEWETPAEGQKRMERFLASMFPLLPHYIPN